MEDLRRKLLRTLESGGNSTILVLLPTGLGRAISQRGEAEGDVPEESQPAKVHIMGSHYDPRPAGCFRTLNGGCAHVSISHLRPYCYPWRNRSLHEETDFPLILTRLHASKEWNQPLNQKSEAAC